MAGYLRRLFLVTILALVAMYSPSLSAPFSTRGQAREAVVVEEMQRQDNLILPLRNGVDIPSKPPLFHWAAYGIAALQGHLDEFATRAPSWIASALALGLMFATLSLVLNRNDAAVATAICGTALEWMRNSSVARVDMVFTLTLTVVFFAMLAIFHRRFSSPLVGWSLAGIAAGLAVLSKGPAALLVPGFAGVLCLVMWVAGGGDWRRLVSVPGVLLALLLAVFSSAWWYWLAYQQGGAEFLQVALLRENIARVVEIEGLPPGHRQAFYFSAVDFLVGFLPWSILLLISVPRFRRVYRSASLDDRLTLTWGTAWMLAFLIAVSLSVSKRGVYLLPAFPALAIILALLIKAPSSTMRTVFQIGLVAMMCVLAVALFGVLFLGDQAISALPLLDPRYLDDMSFLRQSLLSSPAFWIFFALALMMAIDSFRSLYRPMLTRSVLGFAGVLLLVVAGLNWSALPAIARFNSPQKFVEDMKKIVPNEHPLYYFQDDYYSVIYYANRDIPPLPKQFPREASVFTLVSGNDLKDLRPLYPDLIVRLESDNNAFYGKSKLVLVELPSVDDKLHENLPEQHG